MNTKFSVDRLKVIAIIAMLIDHISFIFLSPTAYANPPDSFYFILYEILRGIGRLTMPLMVFCLVEGFIHTQSISKYLLRLAVFAIPSHFAYVFFISGSFFPELSNTVYFHTSIISNLFLTLLFLVVAFKSSMPIAVKIILSFVLLVLSLFCDWSFYPLLLSAIFYLTRKRTVLKIFCFIVSIPFWIFFYKYTEFLKTFIAQGQCSFVSAWQKTTFYFFHTPYYMAFSLGLLLVVPFLILYNGKKSSRPDTKKGHALKKYFFYIFYPVHLLLLRFIAMMIN